MNRIHKYQIAVEDTQTVKAPKGAAWLSVQTQRGTPCLLALVDDEADVIDYEVSTRGTGHDALGLRATYYVGTYQLKGGALIFHVFVR